MKEKEKSVLYEYRYHIGGAFFFVISVLIINYFLITSSWPKPSNSGEFGDMYGVVNAFFSGLAFAGIIAAIVLQSKELELQRKELADTRKVFELQSKTLTKQQFENTFFNLLNLYDKVTKELNFSEFVGRELKGREALKVSYTHIQDSIEKTLTPQISLPQAYEEVITWARYGVFIDGLRAYFRIVYNIMSFIDRSGITDDEQDFYAGLLRSLLTVEELNYLALNCISSVGSKNMMPLMIKHNMFKHISASRLIAADYIAVLRPLDQSE